MRPFLVLSLAAALLRPLAAQADPDSALAAMTRRVFASAEFATRGFGPARWLDGGAAYTTLERATGGSGARVLVRAARLVPAGDSGALAIEDYRWSPDGARLLIFTNSERVWRDNTRGDYWVLTLATGTLRKLGGPDAPPSTLMFAKFSPDGGRVAYVRAGDLY